MKLIRSGVTRWVLLIGPFAIKVPKRPIRGWLGNRSEWKQRHRPDVSGPLWSIGHVVLVCLRAEALDVNEYRCDHNLGDEGHGDECKGSSWGRFGDRWLLIDYDRAWEQPRGLVGSLYYGNQERLARKWMRLPVAP